MEQKAAAHHRYTLEEYFRREDQAHDKHEFHDGEIVAMAGGSPEHSLIIANVTRELGNQLKGSGCNVYDSNLRLQMIQQRLYSYGDATVVCGEPQILVVGGVGKVCANPRVVVEVLSPTSEVYDRTAKFDRYREIESFQEYVLVSQDSARVETYFRQPDGGWRIDFALGVESVISLRSVPATLPLAEIYAGLTLTPTQNTPDEENSPSV